MSIDTVTVRGGVAPWVDTVVEWSGTSDVWTLSDSVAGVLYTGPDERYVRETIPETIYWMTLEDDSSNSQTFAYVTPPISAPVGLVATDITHESAVLEWMPLDSITTYEVQVDDTSYNVLPPPPPADPETEEQEPPSLALGGLISDRTYSSRVRAFMENASSLWSPLIYFTTDRTIKAEATEYEYEPYAARTWNSNGWTANGSLLVHGDGGDDFGVAGGIHTTIFMYSQDVLAMMHELMGVQVLAFEVSLTRLSSLSDPRMVMSHWLLHDIPVVPADAPAFVGEAMGVDSGSLALGQQSWIPLPTGWANAMLAGNASGIGWGGVKGRYMTAAPLSDETEPVNGTIRITVG